MHSERKEEGDTPNRRKVGDAEVLDAMSTSLAELLEEKGVTTQDEPKIQKTLKS
jgi:hypothetical protein